MLKPFFAMVNSSKRLTPVDLVERDVVLKRTGNCHQQSYMRPTAVLILLLISRGFKSFYTVTGRFDTSSSVRV